MTGVADIPWATILREAIAEALSELHTGLPAIVQLFDPSTQSCTVKPALKSIYLDALTEAPGLPVDMPLISNVPVQYDAGGGYAITFPLAKGDIVYLAFAERSLDRWLQTDGARTVNPTIADMHPLDGAVAIPGMRPRRAALAGLAKGGLRVGREDGSTELVITDGKITLRGMAIDLGGDGQLEGSPLGQKLLEYINAKVVLIFNTHTHPVSGASTLVPGALIEPATPDLLSASVKVQP